MRILKRWLRMRQMRRHARRVRRQMWKSVLNSWCKLARDAAQRVEEFEMVRSAAMGRVTRDAARVACGSSNGFQRRKLPNMRLEEAIEFV